jgi:hypothetical protein
MGLPSPETLPLSEAVRFVVERCGPMLRQEARLSMLVGVVAWSPMAQCRPPLSKARNPSP